MDFKTFTDLKFDPPFKKNGEPQKYLRLLIPLFEKDFTTKVEMLKLMGVDIVSDPTLRNTHSTTLAKLSRAKILSVKARGNGSWRRGENWSLFMAWVTQQLIENPKLKNKFKDMLIKYDSNSLEFFMKD